MDTVKKRSKDLNNKFRYLGERSRESRDEETKVPLSIDRPPNWVRLDNQRWFPPLRLTTVRKIRIITSLKKNLFFLIKSRFHNWTY